MKNGIWNIIFSGALILVASTLLLVHHGTAASYEGIRNVH